MKKYDSVWWAIELPDSWRVEQDDTCTTISSPSAFGAFQISAARNSNGPATDEDLKDFAKDHLVTGADLSSVSCGAFSGYSQQNSTNNLHKRQWWLRAGNTVVFATYTCDLKFKGKEDRIVRSILGTLKVK